MPSWFQGAAVLKHRTSDVNGLRPLAHARSNVLRLSSGILCIQYVAVCIRNYHNYARGLILTTEIYLFQQCVSAGILERLKNMFVNAILESVTIRIFVNRSYISS